MSPVESSSRIEQRLAELHALVRVIAQINRSLDPAQVRHASLEGLREFVGGEFGCFLLLQDDAPTLRVENAVGLAAPLLAQLQNLACPLSTTTETRAVDLSTIGQGISEILRAHGIQSFILLPLTARQRALGILLIGVHPGKVLSPLSIDLLLSIGEQIGMALEHARLHTALAESEAWHRAFIENSPDGFWETDAEGNVVYVNLSACRMLGYSRAELLKMRRADFLVVDPTELRARLVQLERDGFLTNQYAKVRVQSGETRTIQYTMRVVRDARGETQRRQAIFRDVTAEMAALDALRQRTHELNALNQIAGILNHPLELTESLGRVCEQIVSLTGMDAVGLYVLDDAKQHLNLIAQRGLSQQLQTQVRRLGVDDPAVAIIVQEGKALALNELSDFPVATSFAGPRAEGYHAGIGVPLRRREAWVGALYVGSKTPRRYTQAEVDLIQNIANQIGVALENADLYERMRQRVSELEGLAQLSATCVATFETAALARLAVNWTTRLLRAHTTTIRLLESDTVRLFAQASASNQENPTPYLSLDAVTRRIVRERVPYTISDTQTDSGVLPFHREHLQKLGLRSLLAVPLFARERVLGILATGHAEPHAWTSHEVDLAQTIANVVASAMDNAQLYQHALTEQRKVQAIFDSGLSGLFATDAQGRIVMFNRAAERITGWTLDEVRGKSWQELFSDDTVGNPAESLLARALSHKETRYAFDGRKMRTKDGRVIPIAKATAPLLDDKDNVIGAVGAFWDLSREQRAQIEYENFLAMLAHQIRSPLSSVLSALELFEQRNLAEAQRAELWSIIKTEGQHLRRLADQFLEHQTALKSTQAVRLERFAVGALARQLVRQFRAQYPTHQFRIRVVSPAPCAFADSAHVESVLRNLLENAVAYSPENTSVYVRVTTPDQDWIVVSVQDEGIGIPVKEQANLFRMFYRVPQTSARRIYGHGLGLALAKEMVTAMGGKIWVESEEGQGATFYFSLRRAP